MLESWTFSQIKRIFYCDQSLFLQSVGNQKNPRNFSILKIEWSHGGTGYSCLSPLPHLGDLDCVDLRKELVRNLQFSNPEGEYAELISQTQRDCLMKSLDYNYNFQSLLLSVDKNNKRLQDIKSNFLVSQITTLQEIDIDHAIAGGYEACKIKLKSDELDLFFEKLTWLQKKEIRIRIDFNAGLQPQHYFSFVNRIDGFFSHSNAVAQVDYIEDPCTFLDIQSFPRDEERLLQFPIYLDNELPVGAIGYDLHPAVKGFVLKPAKKRIDNYLEVAHQLKLDLTFTSYMDHDLSILQSFGEILACEDKKVIQTLKRESQGFQTSKLFEPFEGNVLTYDGPHLKLQEDYKAELMKYLEERHWLELR